MSYKKEPEKVITIKGEGSYTVKGFEPEKEPDYSAPYVPYERPCPADSDKVDNDAYRKQVNRERHSAWRK